jgi:tetratricopeptide (TPR) repeat protein
MDENMEEQSGEYNLAIDALDAGDIETGMTHLDNAAAVAKDDPDMLHMVAYAYLYHEKYDEALPLLKRCLKLRPDFALAKGDLADTYKELGMYRLAFKSFREYFSIVDADNKICQLATAYRRVGKHEQAVALYAAGLVLDPTDVAAYNNMAMSLTELGRFNEAVKACRKGLKLAPGDCDLTTNLASAHREAGRPKLALRILNEIDESCAETFGMLLEIGNALCDLMRYDEAAAAYNKAKKLDPSSISPHINLGIMFDHLGQLAIGEQEFREALLIDPEDAGAHNNLGASLDLQGRKEEALAEYKIAVRLDPKDPLFKRNVKSLEEGDGTSPP